MEKERVNLQKTEALNLQPETKATGVSSKGSKLSYKKSETYEILDGLQEIPELGGSVEKLDVTTLADSAKRNIPSGVKDYGDLSFAFLFDNSSETANYRILKGLEDAKKPVTWKVEFPDGTSFEFSGIPSVKINAVGLSSVITFNLEISLQSDIVPSNPIVGA